MAKVRARLLVIDASVAHNAGDREAASSCNCTEFLKALQACGHRVAFSASLLAEWQRHQTGFARGWLRSMYARRLVESLAIDNDSDLRRLIERAAPQRGDARAMLKDAHLIELARASEDRIVSLDEAARFHFRQAARAVVALAGICWVNCDRAEERAIEWLQTGAPADRHRRLSHVPSEE